jgi:hypothetical protein
MSRTNCARHSKRLTSKAKINWHLCATSSLFPNLHHCQCGQSSQNPERGSLQSTVSPARRRRQPLTEAFGWMWLLPLRTHRSPLLQDDRLESHRNHAAGDAARGCLDRCRQDQALNHPAPTGVTRHSIRCQMLGFMQAIWSAINLRSWAQLYTLTIRARITIQLRMGCALVTTLEPSMRRL